jgi:hypothetical protein
MELAILAEPIATLIWLGGARRLGSWRASCAQREPPMGARQKPCMPKVDPPP